MADANEKAVHIRSLSQRWFDIALWKRVTAGLVCGLLVGLALGEKATFLKPIGDIFISLMKMLVVPLVATMLFSAIASLQDADALRRLGIRSVLLYLSVTAFAVVLAIAVSYGSGAGASAELPVTLPGAPGISPAASDANQYSPFTLLIPENPFEALSDGRMIQIIFFSILFALAAIAAGKQARPFIDFMQSASDVVNRLIGWVIELAPFGVFAIMAWVGGTMGLNVLLPLAKLVLIVHIAIAIQVFVVNGILIKLLTSLPLLPFFRGIIDAQILAYSTTSSSATLPVTMRCVVENLGVSKSIAEFSLPVGAVVNMSGSAIYHSMVALFVAHATGMEITLSFLLFLVLIVTTAAVSASTVPGGGLVTMTFVFESLGLPLAAIAIMASIDRLLDGPRTLANVTGDAMVAVILAKGENQIDMHIYRDKPKL